MAIINEVLPPEMLERVFHMLPHRDLERAVLVCRRWRDVGEAPSLWAWVSPHCRDEFRCRNHEEEGCNLHITSQMLGCNKFQAIEELRVSAWSEGLLEAALNHKGLKRLIINQDFTDNRGIPDLATAKEITLFYQVLQSMEEIEILPPNLHGGYINEIVRSTGLD